MRATKTRGSRPPGMEAQFRGLLEAQTKGRRAAAGRSPYGLVSGIFPVSSGEPPAMGTSDLLEGYDTMPWLRGIASKVGGSVAGVLMGGGLYRLRQGGKVIRIPSVQRAFGEARWKMMTELKRKGLAELVEEHPFYQAIAEPNPFMSGLGLYKITTIHVDLVGDSYWVKERNRLGTPVGYWPVPPHWVMEHPTPSRSAFRIGWRSWQVTIPESEIVWFHEPSVAHPYARGSGVGWALGDEFEVDEYAAKMAKQLFYNRARPDFVFMGGPGTSEPELRRLKQDWVNRLQGFWRAFQPYFMTGSLEDPYFDVRKHIYEFQQPTMEQLVYPNLRQVQRDIALQTWGGIPPEMFGVLDNSNRATIDAAKYLYTSDVVVPRAENLRWTVQLKVIPDYDERGVFDYPSPVPEDRDYELSVRKAAPWAWQADELRALAGDAPLPDGKGQVHLVPLNSYATPDLLDATRRPATGGAALRATDQNGEGDRRNG